MGGRHVHQKSHSSVTTGSTRSSGCPSAPISPTVSDSLRPHGSKFVRAAVSELSDRSCVLDSFDEVCIEDRLTGTHEVIRPKQNGQTVDVFRNEDVSSSWRLFNRSLPNKAHLDGEITVGVRIEVSGDTKEVRAASDTSPSAPFHLFFPTRIASGLPFLLHGYFEVDAARTGFYRGSNDRNAAILGELADLTAEAVEEVAADPSICASSLVNLIALCNDPEDRLARDFREQVLAML